MDIVAKTKTPIALNIPAAIIFEFTILIFQDKDKKNSLTSSEFYILKKYSFIFRNQPLLHQQQIWQKFLIFVR
jgi:hypothetical protein